jgi:hypothetical protein
MLITSGTTTITNTVVIAMDNMSSKDFDAKAADVAIIITTIKIKPIANSGLIKGFAFVPLFCSSVNSLLSSIIL